MDGAGLGFHRARRRPGAGSSCCSTSPWRACRRRRRPHGWLQTRGTPQWRHTSHRERSRRAGAPCPRRRSAPGPARARPPGAPAPASRSGSSRTGPLGMRLPPPAAGYPSGRGHPRPAVARAPGDHRARPAARAVLRGPLGRARHARVARPRACPRGACLTGSAHRGAGRSAVAGAGRRLRARAAERASGQGHAVPPEGVGARPDVGPLRARLGGAPVSERRRAGHPGCGAGDRTASRTPVRRPAGRVPRPAAGLRRAPRRRAPAGPAPPRRLRPHPRARANRCPTRRAHTCGGAASLPRWRASSCSWSRCCS